MAVCERVGVGYGWHATHVLTTFRTRLGQRRGGGAPAVGVIDPLWGIRELRKTDSTGWLQPVKERTRSQSIACWEHQDRPWMPALSSDETRLRSRAM